MMTPFLYLSFPQPLTTPNSRDLAYSVRLHSAGLLY